MKTQPLLPTPLSAIAVAADCQQQESHLQAHGAGAMHHASKAWLVAGVVSLIAITWQPAICRAQQASADEQGAQVLTRGPVHEAFAGIVTFNPEPGVVVPRAAPEAIEEIPPEERPEGDNVAWIPGYWAWDDERSDFLWISGIWRALPPGRQWIAGYWGQTSQGFQWTSGYWADAAAQETTYLPPPPPTVESGPNIEAPSRDYGWTPGCWVWRDTRYAWRPGCWTQGRADWAWMPAHYVWTPRGYIFVDGYWDHSVARRGVVFAPVYFESGVYARSGFSYSPSLAINLALFAEQLFLRPHYHHYYFGDYYAPGYVQGGFHAASAYRSNRFGYDPLYSHQRWEHRQDRDWERRVEESYQYRRDHENARPPRTWAAMRTLDSNTPESKRDHAVVATPIDQLAKRKDGQQRFQAVPQEDRQKLAQRGQDVRKSRDERRTLEVAGADVVTRKPGEVMQPATTKLPKSPIMGRTANQLKKDEKPPETPRTPKTDLRVLPKSDTSGRQTGTDTGNPQLDPRKTDLTPRTKPLPVEPQAPDLTPRTRPLPGEPRKPDVVPRDKPLPVEPRATDLTPRTKPLPVEPRATDLTPRTKPLPVEPQAPDLTPRIQPLPVEPQAPDLTPRTKPQPVEPRVTDLTPRTKPLPVEPRKTDVVPRTKPLPGEPRATDLTPRTKPLPGEPRATDLTPRTKPLPVEPRATDLTPRTKPLPVEPRATDLTPRTKPLPVEPRKTDVVPRTKPLPVEPRVTDLTPRTRPQPVEPRKTDVVPRDTQVQPVPTRRVEVPQQAPRTVERLPQRVIEPPVKEKAVPRDNVTDQPGKKDRKKDDK